MPEPAQKTKTRDARPAGKVIPADVPQPSPSRRTISNVEKVQWALERYGPLRNGHRLKAVNKIAAEHGRKPVIVTRGILQAFKEGWVEMRETLQPIAAVERVGRIERELEKCYDLHAAIVVSAVPEPDDPARQTDMTHRCLGVALARFLSESVGFFRSRDVIGFGSGRAVYYTVEALRHLPPLRVGALVLASVTGALHARDYTGELAAVCDGDFHANLCAMSVVGRPRPEMRLMHTPLVCTKEKREQEFTQTWLGGPEWNTSPVSHLMCGTGVLVRGHRLHLSAEPKSTEAHREEAGLEPIAKNLRALSKIADGITKAYPNYHPVGDICNFLFYVENPEIAKYDAKEIRRLIDEVNGCLLNLQEEQLFEIGSRNGSIMLIAGTGKKRGAITQLLTADPFRRGGSERRKLNIKYLCTDELTAAWLLDQ